MRLVLGMLQLLIIVGALGEEQEILLPRNNYRSNEFAMLPDHKLLFCRIHKAGSSAISDLVTAISPPPNPEHPSWTYHQPSDHGYGIEAVEKILRDPTWIKVVIYRDPLERFLSAYRSKCEDFDADQVCSNVFHGRNPSFAGAVRQFILKENFSPDGHFYPQAEICTLRTTLPFFSERFILVRSTAHATISRILDEAHVERTEKVNAKLKKHFAPPGEEPNSTHITHSEQISTLLKYYNHDCLIRLIVFHYQVDYSVFHLPCPDWAVGALERTTVNECMEYIKSHRFD